ncbi:MAG: MinD/ParA family protein [Halobaculum sp.]
MILAVCSGKGGVGKSTLTYELAGALDALAVDADLGMADLPRGRGPDLHDVLAGRAAPAEAVRGGPVDVLQCGRSLSGARAVDLGDLAAVVAAVTEDRDAILDCPPGLRADVGVPLALADACLLVTSTRRWALADAIRTRAVARDVDAGLAAVAVSRADTAGDTSTDPPVAVVREVLSAPTTVVPESSLLSDLSSGGPPVVDRAPDSDAAAAIRDLAETIRACRPYHDSDCRHTVGHEC